MEKILSIPVNRLEFSSIDSNLAKATLYVMHEGMNLNESVITLPAIQDAESTISNIPILAYVNKDNNGNAEDFGGHELKQELETVNGQLTLKTTFLEQPIGVVPETNGYHYEEIGGQQWVVVNGYIWKNYSNEAFDLLEQAKTKGISMEIKVIDGEVDKRTGFYVIKKFAYLGITVLGDEITPAMGDSARMEMFSVNDKNEYFSMCKTLNEELKVEMGKEVESLEFAKEKGVENTGDGNANGMDVKEEIKQIQEAEMMSETSEDKALGKLEVCPASDMKAEMKDAKPLHLKDEEEDSEKHACKDEESDTEKDACKDEEKDTEKDAVDSKLEEEEEEKDTVKSKKDEESEKMECDDDSEKHSIKEEKVKTDNEDDTNRKANEETAKEVDKVSKETDSKEEMSCKDDEKENFARKKKVEPVDNSDSLSANYITEQVHEQLDKYKENVKAWWSETGTAEMPKYMMIDLLIGQKVVIVSDYDSHFYGIPYTVTGDEVTMEMSSISPYISSWKKKETAVDNELKFEAKGSRIANVQAIVDAGKEHYELLETECKSIKEEVNKLREFKLEIDKQTRFVEIDELIGEFRFTEDEVSELKQKAYSEEISMDGLKKELFALEGMKSHQAKAMYSAKKKNPVLGYSINTEKQAKTSKYGEASIYFK